MAKLRDAQLIVLSQAAQRDDGAALLPDGMTKATAAKLASSLIGRKLMREVRAKADMPVWRKGDDDRSLSLIITRAGREAIGVSDEGGDDRFPIVAVSAALRREAAKRTAKSVAVDPSVAPQASPSTTGDASPSVDHPRAGSKQASLVEILSKPDGATINTLMTATGWLPHTTRAALTGLRKRGFQIVRTARERDASLYSIAVPPAVAEQRKTGKRP